MVCGYVYACISGVIRTMEVTCLWIEKGWNNAETASIGW